MALALELERVGFTLISVAPDTPPTKPVEGRELSTRYKFMLAQYDG